MSWPTVDYHTAGEPFRIVLAGVAEIPGRTVLERRESARVTGSEADRVRGLLCREPRGHAGMYGCFLVPPNGPVRDAGDPSAAPSGEAGAERAVLGVLFFHNDGFSTACGHGTIALGSYAVDENLVAAPDNGQVRVPIDVPSGRVVATVLRRDGRTTAVRFGNVPAFPVARVVPVTTASGPVTVDIAWGGALYASVAAADLGLTVSARDLPELVRAGRDIQSRLNEHPASRHPAEPNLSGIYGVIFYDELGDTETLVRQSNVTVFADGQVDRSPCGSGTSARLALLHQDGRARADRPLEHQSIVGTTFLGRLTGVSEVTRSWSGGVAVDTEIEGMARRTGRHEFDLDPEDELPQGFLL